ncbi:hypothetical protein [Amphritea balenae]|uniref:DUF2489 domain-containing protein n=1 Tax=Amphritea balenae TaxID=452629 RepID=A0A3P1SMS5_9GAMM|nr:hypothetical protein [Amphritea balenae]RRC98330.1 hypothetical protein EHS89_14675 [Amphritea balenae]GGK81016.1 hypothetical protein GCM10007941_34300 [Amphritea balenae]
MEITIFGVLTGAVLPLIGYLVFHRLALTREVTSRKAQASNDFRKSIISATSKIPDVEMHWGEQEVLMVPAIHQEIVVASEIFKYFLDDRERERFDSSLKLLDNLLTTHLPNALSRENVMYPSEKRTPSQAKAELRDKIEDIVSFAKET